MSIARLIIVLSLSIILFNACEQNTILAPKNHIIKDITYLKLNDAVNSLANQLSTNSKLNKNDTSTVALTSFVNLKQLSTTSKLGRVIGESLFSELFVRGFNIRDFRGQGVISINNQGEFFITRNVNNLEDYVPNTYVLVGTYSQINKKIMINARMMDNQTGKLISTARVMYANNNCNIFESCTDHLRKIKIISNKKSTILAVNK